MKHDLKAFSHEIVSLIKGGDAGGSGDKSNKSLPRASFFVPARQTLVSPPAMDWGHDFAPRGDRKGKYSPLVGACVPSAPTATSDFWLGKISDLDAPAEWHAVLEELERREPVDGFGAERWADLVSDAESFLSRWGGVAYSLGWTSLDLFGVHPIAPAGRFDVMGLIPMLNRAEVLALTRQTATMRRPSGAVLTYRRSGRGDAILLSDLRP
jgi:hypothetical protein